MLMRIIKQLFVSAQSAGIVYAFVEKIKTTTKKKTKLLPGNGSQYGFSISKCCCQLPDNIELLSAVDCLLNV